MFINFFLKLSKNDPIDSFRNAVARVREKIRLNTHTSVSPRNSVVFDAKRTCPRPHGLLNALDSVFGATRTAVMRYFDKNCYMGRVIPIYIYIYNRKTKRVFCFCIFLLHAPPVASTSASALNFWTVKNFRNRFVGLIINVAEKRTFPRDHSIGIEKSALQPRTN